ncbi:MAG: PAS domain S-box protein [Dehalococcoidia bacterium]|nr:PAS domain S-box protein [Dehalococcoidia bacterium]
MDKWDVGPLSEQIVHEMPDGVVVADRDGIVRFWNVGAQTIFGYMPHEAVGKSLDLIIPERHRGRHWEGYRRVMQTGVTRYSKGELLAVPALRKDGTRISVEFSLALLHDAAGANAGAVAVVRDVTARWERDKALKERLAALEAKEPWT